MAIIRRKSCRALIVTPQREILLMQIHNPDANWIGWITPGGGMDPGENEETALRRELREELGFEGFKNHSAVWKRFHSFDWRQDRIEQSEVFFLIEAERFEPDSTRLQETEMLDIQQLKWWKIEDIGKSKEVFGPRTLYLELTKLLKSGLPLELVDVGQ